MYEVDSVMTDRSFEHIFYTGKRMYEVDSVRTGPLSTFLEKLNDQQDHFAAMPENQGENQTLMNRHNGCGSSFICVNEMSRTLETVGDMLELNDVPQALQDALELPGLSAFSGGESRALSPSIVEGCPIENLGKNEIKETVAAEANMNGGDDFENFSSMTRDETMPTGEDTVMLLQSMRTSGDDETEEMAANNTMDSDTMQSVPERWTRASNLSTFQPVVNPCDKNSIKPLVTPLRGRFACAHCPKTFKFTTGLERHVQRCHRKTSEYQCDTCSRVFLSKTSLAKHLASHLGFAQPPGTKEAGSFRRSQRSLAARNKRNLKKHISHHTAKEEHKRPQCSFSSKRKYSLERHLSAAHSNYACTLCSFNTASINAMKVHAALHVACKATACIVCGTSVKRRISLIEHLMGHTEDENQTCKVCKKKFTLSHEFLLHLWSHRDTLLSRQQAGEASVLDLAAHDDDVVEAENGKCSGLGLPNNSHDFSMGTPTMESKMAELCSTGSKLVDISKAFTFGAESSKVFSQLTELVTLAEELTVISSNVLLAFKKMCSSSSGVKKNHRMPAPSVLEQSLAELKTVENSETGDADPHEIDPSATIKEELQDSAYVAPENDFMQIQMDVKGEPVSYVQKEENILKPGSFIRIKNKRGKKIFQCTRCNQVFNDTRSLKRHIMVHDNIRPYSCSKCSQSFRRKEHLKKHMVTHSEDRPFRCSRCPYTAKTEQRLKLHALSHTQSKVNACTVCSYTARTAAGLSHHMKKHQTRSCTQCEFVCHSRSDMKRHLLTHATWSCPDCEFSTSDRAEYTKHARKHSEVQLLCCELCGYSCNTMKKFKYHQLRHENKTPYQCEDCDYKCSSRASFDCHRLKHAGLKPYLCSFCGAAFRKTSHLNQHILIHKEEKAYKCKECGYSCRTKHNLKEHMMTHSGEKPFTCKYCNFSCRRNKALQLHMAKHENPAQIRVQVDQIQTTLQSPPPYPLNLVVPPSPLPSLPPLPSIQMQMQPHMQAMPLPMSLLPPEL